MRLPVRHRVRPVRDGPVQRASAGLSLIRALAALAVLGASGTLYAVTAADGLRLDPAHVTVEGAVYTPRDAIDVTLGFAQGARPNIFRMRTSDLAASLRQLPAVLDADVRGLLPDRLAVRLSERVPILVWQAGDARYLVDVDGVLFARVDPGAPDPAGTAMSLPTITDRRDPSTPPAVGERLDQIDIAAVRQLAAVTPAMLRSGATALRVSVDDAEGFTVDALPRLWHAVFGFYTVHLRSPEIIPGQVQCLAALLATSEPTVGTVHLSPEGDRCGTYRPRSPAASSAPPRVRPSRSPRASGSTVPPGSPAPGSSSESSAPAAP